MRNDVIKEEPYTSPVNYRPDPEIDPVEEAADYVNHRWVQCLVPMRTQCYHCGENSPIIFVKNGAIAFGNPRMLGKGRRVVADITQDVQEELAKVNWKFQLRRAYCPQCKGLGSV